MRCASNCCLLLPGASLARHAGPRSWGAGQRGREAAQTIRFRWPAWARWGEETGAAASPKARHATEREPAKQPKRHVWRTQGDEIDPAHRVFMDERGLPRSRPRRAGGRPAGERGRGAVPLGPGERTTLIGALALAGTPASFRVAAATAPDLLPVLGEQSRPPSLRPGAVVIGDHRPAHQPAALRSRSEAAPARLLSGLPRTRPPATPASRAGPTGKRLCAPPKLARRKRWSRPSAKPLPTSPLRMLAAGFNTAATAPLKRQTALVRLC
jgi:hypothetical protein